MKEIELIYRCHKCVGCQAQESNHFKPIPRCKNFRSANMEVMKHEKPYNSKTK